MTTNFTSFNVSANTVDWSHVQNASPFLQLANDVTGGWFWNSMYLMFLLIAFLSMVPYGIASALIATCFAGIIIGTALLMLGLISTWVFLITVGLLIMTAIMAGRETKN